MRFPEKLPERLYSHFIRGLWDGDGCFRRKANHKGGERKYLYAELTASYFLIEKVRNILGHEINSFQKIYKHGSVYRISYGESKAKLVRDYLYRNATLFLKRKYDIAYDL